MNSANENLGQLFWENDLFEILEIIQNDENVCIFNDESIENIIIYEKIVKINYRHFNLFFSKIYLEYFSYIIPIN